LDFVLGIPLLRFLLAVLLSRDDVLGLEHADVPHAGLRTLRIVDAFEHVEANQGRVAGRATRREPQPVHARARFGDAHQVAGVSEDRDGGRFSGSSDFDRTTGQQQLVRQ
jgi:hypothetical protein